jgi:hypothetical protein
MKIALEHPAASCMQMFMHISLFKKGVKKTCAGINPGNVGNNPGNETVPGRPTACKN